MKGISLKGRLSKKLVLGAVGVLVLSGAAGGYVLQSGMLAEDDAAIEKANPSGVACTTTDFIKLNRGGQRWLRKYVRTDSPDGIERVRTALRVAGVLAQSEKADLYQVVVLDAAGPEGRANVRGAAIGAEVLFAPDPTRLPDMEQPFIARYATGKANRVGLFYGERVELSPDDIRATLTGMTDRTDCQTLVADASAPVEGDTVGGHGKPAEGQGESKPADGHGAAAEGHEAAAEPGEGHGEGGGETEKPAEGAHEAATEHAAGAASDGGWLSTVTNLIPGMGGGKADAGHAAPAGEAAEGETIGILSTVMSLIPGMGGDEAPPAGAKAPHEPATAKAAGRDPVAPAAHAEAMPAPGAEHNAAATGHDTAPDESGDHQASAVTVPEAAPAPVEVEDKAEHEAAAPPVVAPEETGATH